MQMFMRIQLTFDQTAPPKYPQTKESQLREQNHCVLHLLNAAVSEKQPEKVQRWLEIVLNITS